MSLLLSPSATQMDIEPPRRSHASSPEFEFWMVGNHPELEQENQHTADELFVDGVLLPLHLLSFSNPEPPKQEEVVVPPEPKPEPEQEQASSSIMSPPVTSSKRWKDIFKKSSTEEKEKTTSKSKERKHSSGSGGAELNINIWPFSRSRSAGTGGPARPKAAMSKSSSAPCSRSNSRGERRWAASPARPGVHVGRASPVWQLKRNGAKPPGEAKAGPRRKAGGPRGLNLAPLNGCIGYRGQVSCREERDAEEVVGSGDGGGGGGGGGSLFRLRGLFAKKAVY